MTAWRSVYKFGIVVIIILLQYEGKSQLNSYQPLIDSVSKYCGLFISNSPVRQMRLDTSDVDILAYQSDLKEESGRKIGIDTLSELIKKSTRCDTTYWLDSEIKDAILIKSRNEEVDISAAVEKMKRSSQRFKKMELQIIKFNESNPVNRNIFYLSRPIFDASKTYALIYKDNGHSGLAGGGSVDVYHFENGEWYNLGAISRWRH